ncbi:hypothetical protein, partial [Paenibacillus alkaliterrae]|uniref:hypothetical protein n=1 Tax=Paenibacillus alkaliterrae TaxID=320909 RepID=UPI0039F0C325
HFNRTFVDVVKIKGHRTVSSEIVGHHNTTASRKGDVPIPWYAYTQQSSSLFCLFSWGLINLRFDI